MEYLIKLESLFTPTEWRTVLMLLLVTSSFAETAKRVFFIHMSGEKKKQYIYGTAFIAGIVASVVGSIVGDQTISIWFWIVAGSTAGPLSNMIYWFTLGAVAWKFPKLAEALKGKKPNE